MERFENMAPGVFIGLAFSVFVFLLLDWFDFRNFVTKEFMAALLGALVAGIPVFLTHYLRLKFDAQNAKAVRDERDQQKATALLVKLFLVVSQVDSVRRKLCPEKKIDPTYGLNVSALNFIIFDEDLEETKVSPEEVSSIFPYIGSELKVDLMGFVLDYETLLSRTKKIKDGREGVFVDFGVGEFVKSVFPSDFNLAEEDAERFMKQMATLTEYLIACGEFSGELKSEGLKLLVDLSLELGKVGVETDFLKADSISGD